MIVVYLVSGGALGTLARYGLSVWMARWLGTAFPWGTLAANLAGSFLLGYAVVWAAAGDISPGLRLLVTAGFCGAFTTFSTFSYEAVLMLQQAAWGQAALYLSASVAVALVAVAAGMAAAAW